MKKWNVVKDVLKRYNGKKLPLNYYFKEPVSYGFDRIEKGYIVVNCYSHYSQKTWEIKLTPSEFLQNLRMEELYDLARRFNLDENKLIYKGKLVSNAIAV